MKAGLSCFLKQISAVAICFDFVEFVICLLYEKNSMKHKIRLATIAMTSLIFDYNSVIITKY